MRNLIDLRVFNYFLRLNFAKKKLIRRLRAAIGNEADKQFSQEKDDRLEREPSLRTNFI